jgi:heat shock protein 90kDa beta
VFTHPSDTTSCVTHVLTRDIFLRELISNANDAIEKLRLMALTDKEMRSRSDSLNITIKAVKNEDGIGGRLIISGAYSGPHSLITLIFFLRHWHWNDTGRANDQPRMYFHWCYYLYVTGRIQGTLAKSGTAEFLAKAESQDSTGTGNLIGKAQTSSCTTSTDFCC